MKFEKHLFLIYFLVSLDFYQVNANTIKLLIEKTRLLKFSKL